MKSLHSELKERGLLYQNSGEDIFEKLDTGWVSFYCGFDPTADSLHLGNFIGFMVAVHIMRRRNKYIALTWWATGMVGDPGWKNSEREFLSLEKLDENQKAVSKQTTLLAENLREFTGENFDIDFVNNKDFYKDVWYLDFLREVGKFITVNTMIAKDTVKKRVEDPKQSISYTEFSYMLLQGYDFSRLYKDQNVILQIGWQDQWWNLVTGSELIRKKYDGDSYVLTWPLITDATGKKFGKSEGNALWLDKNKTSPYELYQYFMNTSDEDLSRYMKMLTLIEVDEIDKIVAKHMQEPELRIWQKLLAFKVVEIIHGTKEADSAEKITQFMFGSWDKLETLSSLSVSEMGAFQNAMGWIKYSDQSLFELIVESWLAKSNGEARNALQSWAIAINTNKISDLKYDFSSDFIGKWVLLIQKWKKNLRIISK